MEEKINTLLDCKSRISKAFSNYKKSPKDRIRVSYIESRLESLEQLWQQYSFGHQDLLQSYKAATLKTTDYFANDVYEDVYESYIEYKCELKDVLAELQESLVPAQSISKALNAKSGHIKLPKITIPTFSGTYAEWITFRDLFQSLVHTNTDLDDVQKLHYLKAHLTGEADQLLRHIPITKDNYDQCWKLLEDRYNNKLYLGNCILKRFFSQKTLLTESATDIKNLLDTTMETLNALSNLGIDTGSWDIIVIYIVSQRLDPESRKLWECKVSENASISADLPKVNQFKDFLQTRYHSLEFLDTKPSYSKPKYVLNNNNYKGNVNVKGTAVPMFNNLHITKIECSYCKGEHRITQCNDFMGLDVSAKRGFIQNNGLCFNCLRNGHSVRYCNSPNSCTICHRRHHTMIHEQGEFHSFDNTGSGDDQVEQVHTQQVTQSGKEELPSVNITNHFVNEQVQQVLLATAVVEASSADSEERQLLRTLIDQGSQASFITSAAVQLLGLKRNPVKGLISGLGGKQTVLAKSTVEVTITSRVNPDYVLKVTAYVLDKLTSSLPSARVSLGAWPELKTIPLADPEYYIPNKIDMLLGAEVYAQIIGKGIMKCPPRGSPVAQDTSLGWILSGQVGSITNITCNVVTMHTQVEELLRSFWETESEPNNREKILTPEEQKCENIYDSTTTRDENGRYVVRLPFRDDEPACVEGNSREIALRRLKSLERRLHRDHHLKTEYEKVFHEYLDLEHMVPLSKEEIGTKGLYLPYHAVVREDRETTKVRIVFDASCKGSNDISLNDDLLVGPRLQPDLRHIIMRWRMHPICFIADIVKMYRQVVVDDRDTKYQRILWRENVEDEVKEYKMKRVTFGVSSAPYLAVKSLCQVAIDDGESFPLAAPRVHKDFYMDDLMSGCQTDEEAIEVYKQMTGLLTRGGFILQKWSSNSEVMLAGIQEKIKSKEGDKKFEMKTDEINKILGLTWNRSLDEFAYAVQLPPASTPVTKRKVISDISKLYDPLGWVAPSVITAKIFIQKLWLAGLDWDQELPSPLLEEWLLYREQLSELTKFRLGRWTNHKVDATSVELHGFCDASITAYAAVVYLRVIDTKGRIHVNLITGKTRVAPIKQQSVPRLELNGAVLLAKLLIEVADVLNIPRSNLHAWTDSEIVLAWLSSHPSKWKTFIGNRVSEILTVTDRNQWAHVQSEYNPADCASRGLLPAELIDHQLWNNGPALLREKNIKYINPKHLDTTLEKKSVKVHLTTSVSVTDSDDSVWSKFSSLTRLLRIVSYCRRFLKPKEIKPEYILKRELEEALDIMVLKCQTQAFEEDIRDLKQGRLKKKSKLSTFFPQFDDRGILRVGGRLQMANIGFEQKHPILLPKSSWLTELIIRDAHFKTLHGGAPLMNNYIRSKYCILGLKSLTKAYVSKCVVCIRHAAKIRTQLMGQLPSARVTIGKAFLRSGVDYAGPIQIRVSKGRGNKSYKGYICLFICMATRAIHLEAVSDLTAMGFIAAFKRFIGRRGDCTDIYSDNGSNFVGASKELKKLFNAEKSALVPEIADALAIEGTQWHFGPPYAPNFGGLWEAGIKSCKFHLKRVIGNSTLTFEEMTTVLTQVEACLNSRPLSRIEENGESTVLTPGHFLVGEPLVVVSDRRYEDSSVSSLRRWQLCQRMLQNFWKRWSQEYLTQFWQRYKWTHVIPNPQIGDIVLVKEPDLPPARWLLGRVVEAHPGRDNLTRVVTLKCKNNSFLKRPASRICVLPVGE